MSGEDPWDPGPWTPNFRSRCGECGKQIQYVGGQRVEPDCSHEQASLSVEMGNNPSSAAVNGDG